ncbi:MAG: FAD-dependent oxidoreductase, partial [Fimbriimonadales bacterium]
PCGVAWLGAQDDPELLAIAHALHTEQVDYEWLNPSEVASRYPVFALQPHERMLYQNDGGFLRASACVRACLQLAESYGAVVFENAQLAHFESLPNTIRLEFTSGMTVQVDRLVLTAGAWLTHLLAGLSLPLRVTRQTYAYFGYEDEGAPFSPMFLPVWIEATRHFYGFPHDGVQTGVKVAWHQLGETVDPDQPVRAVDEADIEPIRDYLRQRLPLVQSETVLQAQTCLYTNTPDERFLIQPLPSDPRIWFASACSGHGFKFAILNGRRVAEGVLSSTA